MPFRLELRFATLRQLQTHLEQYLEHGGVMIPDRLCAGVTVPGPAGGVELELIVGPQRAVVAGQAMKREPAGVAVVMEHEVLLSAWTALLGKTTGPTLEVRGVAVGRLIRPVGKRQQVEERVRPEGNRWLMPSIDSRDLPRAAITPIGERPVRRILLSREVLAGTVTPQKLTSPESPHMELDLADAMEVVEDGPAPSTTALLHPAPEKEGPEKEGAEHEEEIQADDLIIDLGSADEAAAEPARTGGETAAKARETEEAASSMTALDVDLMNLVLDDLPPSVREEPAIAETQKQIEGPVTAEADRFSQKPAGADGEPPGAHSASTLVPELATDGHGLVMSASTPAPPPPLPSGETTASIEAGGVEASAGSLKEAPSTGSVKTPVSMVTRSAGAGPLESQSTVAAPFSGLSQRMIAFEDSSVTPKNFQRDSAMTPESPAPSTISAATPAAATEHAAATAPAAPTEYAAAIEHAAATEHAPVGVDPVAMVSETASAVVAPSAVVPELAPAVAESALVDELAPAVVEPAPVIIEPVPPVAELPPLVIEPLAAVPGPVPMVAELAPAMVERVATTPEMQAAADSLSQQPLLGIALAAAVLAAREPRPNSVGSGAPVRWRPSRVSTSSPLQPAPQESAAPTLAEPIAMAPVARPRPPLSRDLSAVDLLRLACDPQIAAQPDLLLEIAEHPRAARGLTARLRFRLSRP